jgi:hypothetical protein
MTEQQIDQAARDLRNGIGNHTPDELACRRMMNSFFAYGNSLTDESSWHFQRYLQEYVDRLGRKLFDQVRNEQMETYKKCTISVGVFTDDEGCTYNSINWGN